MTQHSWFTTSAFRSGKHFQLCRSCLLTRWDLNPRPPLTLLRVALPTELLTIPKIHLSMLNARRMVRFLFRLLTNPITARLKHRGVAYVSTEFNADDGFKSGFTINIFLNHSTAFNLYSIVLYKTPYRTVELR